MTRCHPGFHPGFHHAFHHGIHPFFGEATHFDPMFRFGPGGRGCNKFKAHCAGAGRPFAREILVDMTETDSQVQILANVPGVTKDAIRIEVDNNVLTINVVSADDTASPDASAPPLPGNETSPEDAPDPSQADDTPLLNDPDAGAATQPPREAPAGAEETPDPNKPRVLLQQRPKRFAKRSVTLPEGSDASNAAAVCADGVLTITLPKHEKPDTKKRVPIA